MTVRRDVRVVPAPKPGMLDAPDDGDRRRLRSARRRARARYHEIEVARDVSMLDAFRTELGAVVRSASPLLVSVLAIEGLRLDDAVEQLAPLPGWPSRPRLSGSKGGGAIGNHLFRYYMSGRRPSLFPAHRTPQISVDPLVSCKFDRTAGGYLRLEVIDHSLELDAEFGPVWIQTRFGELRIELDFDLPQTVLTGSVGRLLEEIVDYDAWRGRGWRIDATEGGEDVWRQMLVVTTGSVEYRMPWARQS